MTVFSSSQFEVNEAWIIFRLSESPVVTEDDGDFHIFGLMDAASGYMLGTEFVSVDSPGLSQFQAKHILKIGHSHRNEYPKQLIAHNEIDVTSIVNEVAPLGLGLINASIMELWPIVQEAVEGFRQHMSGGSEP